ncbi:helix-turn-helix domain-containing protein [Saccharopolyspora phatthalungensis]|uniref:helix-turn-helix domain-containing protein n=1 Tax=Saccharopolyspora phatthalungensis TaxID=664693 RepID=UPI0016207862
MSEFGQTLRRLREAAGLSQPQLARQAYMSQSSICRYENGKQTPDTTTAQHLDDVLDAGGALAATPRTRRRLHRGDRTRRTRPARG